MEETAILEKTKQSDSCYLDLNQVGFWGRKESGSGLLTVFDPGLILPESPCRWPQVFHTQGIRLRPMTLFNPVFNRQTPIVGINRLETQADEGLGPQPKAGDSSRRSPIVNRPRPFTPTLGMILLKPNW